MDKKYFFMIYIQGERTPVFKHNDINSAEIEARRLSKEHKKKAYILCSIKSIEFNEFIVEDLRPKSEDELPF